MKKVLLSTVVLTAFSLSIILFQISCKKSADATTVSTEPQQDNKILYSTFAGLSSGGGFDSRKLHTSNYDGTDVTDINVVLPTGISIVDGNLSISPDHKTIFFTVGIESSGSDNYAIYACNIDGSNPHLISNVNEPEMGVAY